MRLFISGSAPLLAETHVDFEERTGFKILERYGMTETNMNTSNPYNADSKFSLQMAQDKFDKITFHLKSEF